MTVKVCTDCGQTKPLTDFYAEKRVADGKRANCKTCQKKDVKVDQAERQWRETKPATKLDRMTCPTCGRRVAFRLIREPRINRGRYGAIPGIRKPVRHKVNPDIRWAKNTEGKDVWGWCPAGEERHP